MSKRSVEEIREETIRTVMSSLSMTKNPVNEYIANAVIQAVLQDEAVDAVTKAVQINLSSSAAAVLCLLLQLSRSSPLQDEVFEVKKQTRTMKIPLKIGGVNKKRRY